MLLDTISIPIFRLLEGYIKHLKGDLEDAAKIYNSILKNKLVCTLIYNYAAFISGIYYALFLVVVKGVSLYKYFRKLLLENDFLASCSGISPYIPATCQKYSTNRFQKYLLKNKDITIYLMMIDFDFVLIYFIN